MIILICFLSNFTTCKCVQDDPNQDHLVHYSRFIISPLIKGEGNTLGTAIRRSLLALEGYSVKLVKIIGASHEYAVLDGIVESVNDILVNLKQIVFKGNLTKYIYGSITAEGMGHVDASYIKFSENLDIVNPTKHIATLTQDTSKLNINFIVQNNNQYISVENIDNQKDAFILDHIVSSIKNVNYTVHPIISTEKQTEMLVIEIWTNKSISPKEALNKATKNLINLLKNCFSERKINKDIDDFNHIDNEKDKKFIDTSLKKKQDNTNQIYHIHEMNISNLNLSTRTYNSLHKANVYTIADLLKYNTEDLLKIKNFGRRSVEQVIESLKNIGIDFY